MTAREADFYFYGSQKNFVTPSLKTLGWRKTGYADSCCAVTAWFSELQHRKLFMRRLTFDKDSDRRLDVFLQGENTYLVKGGAAFKAMATISDYRLT